MKTLKSILIAATLICASVVSTMSAQQAAAPAQKHEFKLSIGDSVMIKRECQKYCTGEKPSVWVWDKVHTVRQLGTKKFSDGVLLMNIYSWMCEECLIPVNNDKHAQDSIATAQADPAKSNQVKEPEKAASDTTAAAQQTVQQDSIAATDAETVLAHQGDTLSSTPNFKHNYHRFTIGVRGGASALMHHSDTANWTCGGDAVLDLQYAHYWAKDGRPVDLGIIVGLGIGYHQSGLKANDSTAFTKSNVDYTVIAKDIKETDHQLQLEVPVMFSLIHDNGLFFNFGPKFMIPVYTPYKQTVNQEETHISAYFQETGITVTDETVTGKYTGQQPEEKNGIQFNINVMLTAEIGYEWTLKSGNSLGLGAYANYSVYNSYKNTINEEGLFNLTAPTDDSAAKLDVLSATHAYADKLGYFDAGIKLAYHFNFPKKQYKKYKDSKLF